MRNFVRLAAMAAMVCVSAGMAGCNFEPVDGEDGVDGRNGTDGTNGAQGQRGPVGPAGPAGPQGDAGTPGPEGPEGTAGLQGEPGEPGQPGAPGQNGANGAPGRDGAPGEPGEDGEPGEPGEPAEGEGEGEGEVPEPEPECPNGQAGCRCYGNYTCNDGLECDDNVCVEPEPDPEPECLAGTSGCACYGNGTCNGNLVCDDTVCVEPEPECTQIGCSCDQDDESGCDDGLLCSRLPRVGGENFCDADTDEDGVSDMRDNCLRIANADQRDWDEDGLGDACDGDMDDDRVPNREDHCPRVWDPDDTCQCQPDRLADPHDAAETAACYTGLNATRGVGLCRAGTRTCRFDENTEVISWSACTGEVLPVAEVCSNGLDENCNGAFDDGCAPPPECQAGATRVCGNPAVGQCRQGQQTCGNDSRWAACTGEVRPVAEACNALDDDCDSAVDEGLNCAPAPNGGMDQIRECAPADPVGNWGLSIMGVPNAVIEQPNAAGQCVQMDTLTVSRSNLRFNARRPNAGLYCCGTVAGNNTPQDLCPGLQVFRDGVQLVHGSGAGQLQCQNDAQGNNYRIVP